MILHSNYNVFWVHKDWEYSECLHGTVTDTPLSMIVICVDNPLVFFYDRT